MGEEDQQALDATVAAQQHLATCLEDVAQDTFNMNLYNVQVTTGLPKLLHQVLSIFHKRVVCLLNLPAQVQQCVKSVAYNNNFCLLIMQDLLD
jgi:hypothetical protein